MKTHVLFLFLLLLNASATSQIYVGHQFDMNGLPFHGYFDQPNYSPENNIHIRYSGSYKYEKGSYFDKQGKKHDVKIKFGNSVKYNTPESDLPQKIKATEIKGFTIGVDSFFVTSNFYYKQKWIQKPVFVKYIDEVEPFTFAIYYKFTQNAGTQKIFLAKKKGSTKWDDFYNEETFKENALKYFGNTPYVKSKILDGVYSNANILELIATLKYAKSLKEGTPNYIDKYWRELEDSRRSKFSFRVENLRDSIWSLSYFQDSTKTFNIKYSSFYPHIKNGNFLSYYQTGEIRERTYFEENKKISTYIYDRSGELSLKFDYKTTEPENSSKRSLELIYSVVRDSLGQNLIDSSPKFTLPVKDKEGTVRYYEFKNKQLHRSYRLIKGDTIFQITNPNIPLKDKTIQKKFTTFMQLKKWEGAISEHAHGNLLVQTIVDEKGVLKSYEILNELHPEQNRLVDEFLEEKYLKSNTVNKFPKYKIDGQRVAYEVILPFHFAIDKFYRPKSTYNHDHFWFFQQQQQLFQQQQDAYLRSIQIPSPPPGF